ncbi:hypothetical protein DOTSEDRAFT_55365 [Dothistroma septosporum NZE10]|uniref:Lysosomal dipeptide transporter MFSD1 n=1 Tax=Dothistroma septosporum (strain NZE10 / CBS 128990) TaxID=675120 RepID=N1PHF9_DOTSN|nr:hypothetical protein DOTSEDRAFT_55365 [Dothistroma septosporum NZE10]
MIDAISFSTASDYSTMSDATVREISPSDALTELPLEKEPTISADAVPEDVHSLHSSRSEGGQSVTVPLRLKLLSIVIVSLIGFGAHWSSGVTGAMKSTLKKELDINNAQYAVLEASQDFMVTALILVTGVVTDRIGGAGAMVWGNIVYSIGSIIIAAATTVRSYKLMIGGIVIQSLGDIATQVAQYRIFSSWFAPSHGFAATLGLELGIGKIGSFIGQATANPIAIGTGDFSWVYWTAVFMNIFTNLATIVFWFFRKYCERHYSDMVDPATGEKLRENTKKFETEKVLQLPWPFWAIILFTTFETSTAIVFSQNATELAEQRFNVSSVKGGWYSATAQYIGFFLVPCLGVFLDLVGNRITVMFVCGTGVFLAMCLAAFGPSISGTAASFGIYAVAYSLGPTSIIDGIRAAIWHQDTFGAAYAVKIADNDNNSYDHAVIVYVFLAAGSVLVSGTLLVWSFFTEDLKRLQWTKKQRLRKGRAINAQREEYESGAKAKRNKMTSLCFFVGLILLVLGAWAAYFWGLATGNND